MGFENWDLRCTPQLLYGANHDTVCRAALYMHWVLRIEIWDGLHNFFYGANHDDVCRAAQDALSFDKWDLRWTPQLV